MKIADILRQVADAIDAEQDPGQPDAQIQNPAELSPASAGLPVDTVHNQDHAAEDDLMVPPLQLKTELLKRAVGVDNIYDPGEPRADETHDVQTSQDDLAVLKSRAGIPVAAVMELSNDDHLDD